MADERRFHAVKIGNNLYAILPQELFSEVITALKSACDKANEESDVMAAQAIRKVLIFSQGEFNV